ncbi:MAG: hypothetical protein KBS57_05595 [Alistipes sp.]|nr:hypothetical protein [Candidatus Minthomonas equi]
MKKVLVAFTALLMMSCSPVVYDLAVDVRMPAESDINFKGCPPSVVSVSGRNVTDSILTASMALGMAVRMEQELSLEEGSIPVYSYFSDEIDVSNVDDIAYLLTTAGSDRVIVLDSLQMGDFQVKHLDDMVFYNGEILKQTDVERPFRISFKMFCMDSLQKNLMPLELYSSVSDHLKWSILSNASLEDKKAVSQAVSGLEKVFADIGQDMASMFFPQWEQQQRMVISYENSVWNSAYGYAREFQWDKAMKIWLTLVTETSPEKASYAAYNLSVACEMKEQYDLALEWLELARKKYPFSEIAIQGENVERSMKMKKKY